MIDRNELRRLAEACLAHLDSGPLWAEWEENGPGPVEFLGLLDEIEAVRLANLDCVDQFNQMREERDQLRAALGKIAEFDPAVTHGWAVHVREMARRALKAR